MDFKKKREITDKYMYKLGAAETRFDAIYDAFTEAKLIDPINGINDVAFEMIHNKYCPPDLETFRYMISLGIDPLHDLFIETFAHDTNVELMFMLIDEYGADINQKKGMNIGYLFCNIENENKRIEYLQILLEKGLILNRYILQYFLNIIGDIDKLGSIGIDLKTLTEALTFEGYDSADIPLDTCIGLWNKLKKSDILLSSSTITSFLEYLYQRKRHDIGMVKYGNEINLDDFKIFVQSGVNIHFGDDYFFINSCIWADDNILRYFVESCGCDINTQNSKALETAIRYDKINHAKILLDFGSKVTNDIIRHSLSKIDYINLLIDYDLSLDRIVSNFVRELILKDFSFIYNKPIMIEWLLDQGIDFNQVFRNLLKDV